jgi:hypothetical protein
MKSDDVRVGYGGEALVFTEKGERKTLVLMKDTDSLERTRNTRSSLDCLIYTAVLPRTEFANDLKAMSKKNTWIEWENCRSD